MKKNLIYDIGELMDDKKKKKPVDWGTGDEDASGYVEQGQDNDESETI